MNSSRWINLCASHYVFYLHRYKGTSEPDAPFSAPGLFFMIFTLDAESSQRKPNVFPWRFKLVGSTNGKKHVGGVSALKFTLL